MKELNEYAGMFNEDIEQVQITSVDNNWVTGIVDGHYFSAKVFAEPSEVYGFYKGRISKLSICAGTVWDGSALIYSYDRGGDTSTKEGLRLARLLNKAFLKPKVK
jgi:hypothetical protein